MIILLSACTANKLFTGPAPNTLQMNVAGPPEYQEGFKDGCQSGLATYGSVIYKAYYSFYQNYSMMNNAAYVAGWHESYDYCRWYNLKFQTTGGSELIGADLTGKFLPKELGMAAAYSEMFGDKTPIMERIQGGFQPDEKFSDNFKQGWKDGCDTGKTVYGSDNYKSINASRNKSFVRDTSKIGDHEYESAWYDGINYCRQQLNTHEANWDDDWWGFFDLE